MEILGVLCTGTTCRAAVKAQLQVCPGAPQVHQDQPASATGSPAGAGVPGEQRGLQHAGLAQGDDAVGGSLRGVLQVSP